MKFFFIFIFIFLLSFYTHSVWHEASGHRMWNALRLKISICMYVGRGIEFSLQQKTILVMQNRNARHGIWKLCTLPQQQQRIYIEYTTLTVLFVVSWILITEIYVYTFSFILLCLISKVNILFLFSFPPLWTTRCIQYVPAEICQSYTRQNQNTCSKWTCFFFRNL